MEFYAKTAQPNNIKTGCLVIPVNGNTKQSDTVNSLDAELGFSFQRLQKQNDFSASLGKTLFTHPLNPQCKTERVLFTGLGKQQTLSKEDFIKFAAATAKSLVATTAKDATVVIDDLAVEGQDQSWVARMIAQNVMTALYNYDETKSKKADPLSLKKITLISANSTTVTLLKKGLSVGKAIGTGMNVTRNLGDLPGNICTPSYLANQAKALGRKHSKLAVKVLSEKQMRDLGMGSLLSVSAGSDQPAHLIVMEYKGAAKTVKPHVLVGKGITFDTGGISLKPGAAMDEMKYDMGGAASVFGALNSILALEPKINVVAIIAASENMPSGKATKPGDIVTSMSGKTIEVLNTDAEGRLVLCDALTYAEQFKPKSVIDIATLTGACIVALGKHASGLYSNDDSFAESLLEAGKTAGDKAWHMPLWDEYQSQLDSNFADMQNIGGPQAGSVTAACFLSRFTENYTWAHLDIAGTAWNSGAQKGATGRPVPLLVEYLLNQA